jgi:DNA invertase Pin-like site-specific DNA recombinase
MPTYGYARVSTIDQDVTPQRRTLKAAGCDVIRADKASGTRRSGRTELQVLLDFLQPGDTLVVTRVDRLARSIRDLQDIVHELRERGVTLKATEQPIDTRTASGKAFLDMLGVFAEFKTNLRRERQLEGIAAAKARGAYRGRKRSIDETGVRRLQSQGLGPTEIARQLGIGRASVYRALAGPMVEGCRKRLPGEALINLRRRLDTLPPRHPDRTTLLQNAASLYGVSRATFYRQLQHYVRPKPQAGPACRSGQAAQAAGVRAGALLRDHRRAEVGDNQQKGRHLSTNRAIELLEGEGVAVCTD